MTLKQVDNIQWFHSFDLGNGDRIDGIKPLNILSAEADAIFKYGVQGKSVLDIGAWDGFFSFEAERRGAERIVATDHFCWSGTGWGNRRGFDFVHNRLNSSVEPIDVDVTQLPSQLDEKFDIVLFLGVFYHLKDPYAGLEAAAHMCNDRLVIETLTAMPHEKIPAMRLFGPREIGDDPTNFFAPNLPALRLMLEMFGFSKIEFVASPVSPSHPLTVGPFRKTSPDAVHRTIVHARR